ncbi:MAG: POTRA domain-containing protein, partial [Synechocystis sp.]
MASFEFEGNTAFSDQELAKVLESFTNRPITFAELLGVETAITSYYTEAGYINSGAVIPAGQTFSPKDAVIKIQIIEGKLEDIQVQVEGRLQPNYIKSRLAIATGQPFNRNRLLEALQLLQLNPLIQSISADLTAGATPESSLLIINVKEADTFTGALFTDNSRVRSIGRWQRGLNISQGNVFGWGDSGFINYANSEGSNAISGSYTLPLNP